MNLKYIHHILLIFLVLPFLLANEKCERSTTWGNKYFSKWESDHVDIDKETRCIDCHDDITSQKVKPKNHLDTVRWMGEHGDYSSMKYGYKSESVCYLCHAESQCTSCHQQDEPRSHNQFWKQKGHGVMVSLNRSECKTCHQDAEFCEKCHASTKPVSHVASWGSPANNHCTSCHFPLNSVGAQECAVCHKATPSHDNTPTQPNNALHAPGANCRDCHNQLRHPDNGATCTSCHQ